MQVRLLLADDRELREHIKALIQAEVLSLARREIVNILKEVVGDRVAGMDVIQRLMKDIIKEEVRSALGSSEYSIRETARTIAREEVRELLKLALNNTKVAELFAKES